MAGAVAVMSVTGWKTFTSTVDHHSLGSNSFTYSSKPGWSVAKSVSTQVICYLQSHADLLGAEGEL